MRSTLILVLTLVSLLARPLPARAHAAYIFAWVDGERVCSESYFAKKSKIRGGAVTVQSSSGRTLAEGRTDERGLWCFPAPPVQDLHFAVNAGQGHRAEFVLPARNFPAGNARTAPPSTPAAADGARQAPEVASPDAVSSKSMDRDKTPVATPDALREMVREAVREELQTQLSPIRQALAEQNADSGPSLRDIAGGLGWIVGLAGLAAWYTSTRRKK